jgi:hypothetical protein
MPKYLCAKEVAKLLSRSLKWTYCNAHSIPGGFKIGKSHFWDEEVLTSRLKEFAMKPKLRKRSNGEGVPDPHKLL